VSGDDSGDTAVTQQSPVVIASESTEDEDTLSGLEEVPTVDTMVVPPEDGAAGSDAPKRRRRALPIIGALAVLLIIAAAVLWLLDHV
jgi:hypothetical protein